MTCHICAKPACLGECEPKLAQSTWVGLTDEEIDKLDCVYALWDDGESCTIMGIKDFARAVEAKLKEKNT